MRRGAEGVGAALFATMFALFAWKIVARYVLGSASAWADELVVVLFLWVVFWGCAFVVPERQQIAFDLLLRRLPPGGQRLVVAVRTLAIGGLFLAALPGIASYLLFLDRQRTPVLGWPLGAVYGCFGLFIAMTVLRAAFRLVRLAGPRWQREV